LYRLALSMIVPKLSLSTDRFFFRYDTFRVFFGFTA
jgi:hypothetical protein